MEKKITFQFNTPRFDNNSKRIKASTPYFKSNNELPDFSILPEETHTLYSVSRERSLYPNNTIITDRICLEYEYLKLKYLNSKLEKTYEETNRKYLENFKLAVYLKERKQKSMIEIEKEIKKKKNLMILFSKIEIISNYLNEKFPEEIIDFIKEHFVSIRKYFIQLTNTTKIINLKNVKCVLDLLEKFNDENFKNLIKSKSVLDDKFKSINSEEKKLKNLSDKLVIFLNDYNDAISSIDNLSLK